MEKGTQLQMKNEKEIEIDLVVLAKRLLKYWKMIRTLSGMMILKHAPLPEDILTLGVEGIVKIWRDAKLRAVGTKRAMILINAAEHSVGNRDGQIAADWKYRKFDKKLAANGFISICPDLVVVL